MGRRTFDIVVSSVGLLLTAVLLAAGGLLMWGHVFIDDQVTQQLSAQKIYFPPADSDAVKGEEYAPMREYGGQQLTTGAQARVYAENFIAIHLTEVADGKTYAQVSSAALADPTNAKLKGQADTLFKGDTLRGLLLNAYALWKIGQIALIAAWVAFAAAGVMLVLSILGFVHARRDPSEGGSSSGSAANATT
jgi:hypothetical protein